jgi:hypothetical protein
MVKALKTGGVEAGAPDASREIDALLSGIDVGTKGEYERIPKIWQHAIAAGKRNDACELRRPLAFSLPKSEEPLCAWQAVVVCGGIINGLSAIGAQPRERIFKLFDDNAPIKDRWDRAVSLASMMADDESVPDGTRYDALRILGADDFTHFGRQLTKYANAGTRPELQMGAISALSDFDDQAATETLVSGYAIFTPSNRSIALAGLLGKGNGAVPYWMQSNPNGFLSSYSSPSKSTNC